MENFKTWNIAEFPMTFEDWMREVMEYGERTIKNRLSNLAKIEKAYGPLKEHWRKDRFASLLEELTYTQEDKDEGIVPDTDITIDGDYYTGLATLRYTLKLYARYLEAMENLLSYSFGEIGNILEKAIDILREQCRNNESYTQKQVKELIAEPLKNLLQENLSVYGYSFVTELVAKDSGSEESRDRYDIIGVCNGNPELPVIIIEIDTHRSDQVAKKAVSRLALNPDVKLLYISLVYSNQHKNREGEKKECMKYFTYLDTLFSLFKEPEKRFKGYTLY